MDYVVGSVAALVTGNVTPSRPRIMKRALTPTKHQPSPNVTPKSELVDDRSIFLSPSVQKKKAIVKKSPKRIFQNPDLETTGSGDDDLSSTSPKADKVKKHLKDDLDSDMGCNINATEAKSPKQKQKNKKESVTCTEPSTNSVFVQSSNENTPKKKKKKDKTVSENSEIHANEMSESPVIEMSANVVKSPKKMQQRRQSVICDDSNKENADNELETEPKMSINNKSPTKLKNKSKNMDSVEESNNAEVAENATNGIAKKKNKKRKKKSKQMTVEKTESTENIAVNTNDENDENNQGNTKKKNRKRKKSKSQQNKTEVMEVEQSMLENESDNESTVLTKKSNTIVNPNAITDKESESEHESDNEIESETEEINKKVFAAEPMAEESSDEDEEDKTKPEQLQKSITANKDIKNKGEVNTEDEIKRTLFVGNVPFSVKCKKEIKKIFNKHGQIETIRIRTVPVKDGRYTPKLAVIKNELHPERTTVNVYIKYADEESVEKALAENNTVLNDHHLRVSRSSCTGAEHDPKCSIFLGNLPFAIEDETLRVKFEKCGEIESVRIIRDKKTNAGKGFGYVNFASKDAVELALALTEEDLTIKNRIIRVKRCTQLTNKQKQPSDKGGFKKSLHQRPNQGNQRFQSGQRQHQGNQRVQTGQRQNQGNQRWNQGFQRDNQGGQRHGNKDEAGREGAHRRIMHKRKSQDGSGGDGPPNKRPKNINQPSKEKKTRKEFVGMTAEKKKKRKFDKGQKKKKALSEILTK